MIVELDRDWERLHDALMAANVADGDLRVRGGAIPPASFQREARKGERRGGARVTCYATLEGWDRLSILDYAEPPVVASDPAERADLVRGRFLLAFDCAGTDWHHSLLPLLSRIIVEFDRRRWPVEPPGGEIVELADIHQMQFVVTVADPPRLPDPA